MKVIFIFLWVLVGVSDLFAEEAVSPLSLSTSATYGDYSGSVQREKIISESLALSYTPTLSGGFNLSLKHSSLTRKLSLPTIEGIDTNLSYYHFFTDSSGNYIGAKTAVHHISSDDTNSNGATIPHLSLSYKPANLLSAFEIGYTHTPYSDTTAKQITLMGATSLFNQWVWSQTRVYYTNLSAPVQSKNHTIAVEERLSYYAIPRELTLSLYALFGERIYTYDVDLGAAYNLPDIQKGTLGLSLNYRLAGEISIFADFTQEKYDNVFIPNQYRVGYWTAGVSTQF